MIPVRGARGTQDSGRDEYDGLAGQLAALQLADSAFPSGRYTLSHGLEALAQSGWLDGPDLWTKLLDVLEGYLRFGVATSDGVALACAHRATGRGPDVSSIVEADRRLHAAKLSREAREASTRTGRALLRTAESAFPNPHLAEYADRVLAGRTPGNHAVVLGVLTASLSVPRLFAVASELHALAAGWVSAATRLALIDHRAAQALLHEVHPAIARASRDVAERSVTEIGGCTPHLDVMSMQHEEAELRLFAS
ncbi:urease accessory UreF family protein [Nocardioides sp. YIM 152315]|uniref:urease accessory protein UreF n=1 Tax=Nocardioides sp. YIM 152315 TaxID=3031760 RepID=UPI0023DC9389|nr:urease accessory UreF family protein [Nocardioides sp. YIM 152315]MDF1603219.1 urease accessory UreF family protein [Nocardioides sp. YIM 152315]